VRAVADLPAAVGSQQYVMPAGRQSIAVARQPQVHSTPGDSGDKAVWLVVALSPTDQRLRRPQTVKCTPQPVGLRCKSEKRPPPTAAAHRTHRLRRAITQLTAAAGTPAAIKRQLDTKPHAYAACQTIEKKCERPGLWYRQVGNLRGRQPSPICPFGIRPPAVRGAPK